MENKAGMDLILMLRPAPSLLSSSPKACISHLSQIWEIALAAINQADNG